MYPLELRFLKNKPVFLSLTSVYGVGHKTSLLVCKKMGFSKHLKSETLSISQIEELTREMKDVAKNLSHNLKKYESLNFKRLVSIKSFKGLRRYRGLPTRGQRTHTNAKTAKKRGYRG